MAPPSDVVLIADYGRSGQGWLSYMLCYVLNARFIEPYAMLDGRAHSTSAHVLALSQGDLPGREATRYRLVVKTHQHPVPRTEFKLTDKVVFLTRDPRDVSISAMFYHRNAWRVSRPGRPLAWIVGYLRTTLPGSALDTARRWARFRRAWAPIPSFHVRYEDLRRDPHAVLRAILDYLEVHAPDALIADAVEQFTFQQLTGRTPGTEAKDNSEFRKGIVGDYKNHYPSWLNRALWFVCGTDAAAAGYRANGEGPGTPVDAGRPIAS